MKRDKLKKEKLWLDEDISFKSPDLSTAQQNENLASFGNYRKKSKGKISDKDRLTLRFLRLKYHNKKKKMSNLKLHS